MNKILTILALTLAIVFCYVYQSKTTKIADSYTPPIENPIIIAPDEPELIVTPEPEWTNYPARRNITNLGTVLSDIESHMPANHIYKDSDKITWAHETSHGIASNLRMKFQRGRPTGWMKNQWKSMFGAKRVNGFYILNNKVAIIEEPNTTIQAVAKRVPRSLIGGVYNLYLIEQARSWGNTPLYLFDEWNAYILGSACRLDLDIKSRSETVLYMLEFNVYATCVAMTSQSEDPQFKNFLMWNLERSMNLYKDSKEKLGNSEKHDHYLEKMRTNADAAEFRDFCRMYYGEQWTKKVLGF